MQPASRRVIDWDHVSLLGIDVGFSATAKSTGIALYKRGRLVTLTCVCSAKNDRDAVLPRDVLLDAVAIDGPVVPDNFPLVARSCELVLSRGAFARRCKPGLSHFGFGLPLRAAATAIAREMRPRLAANGTIVEAFPNAFLGVLLSEDEHFAIGKIERGRKSDVFYARLAARGGFDAIFDLLGCRDDALRKLMRDLAQDTSRAAHDKRAALVCLLTAAWALAGRAEFVGDVAGGFICLPPKELWAAWARAALPSPLQTC